MTQAFDLPARQREIRSLAARSELQAALKLVMSLVDDFPSDEDRDESVLISSSLREIEKLFSREKVGISDWLRERERIIRRMLDLTTAISERLALEVSDA